MAAFRWAVIDADLDAVRRLEQRRVRPVIVVSNEEFSQGPPSRVLVPALAIVPPVRPGAWASWLARGEIRRGADGGRLAAGRTV